MGETRAFLVLVIIILSFSFPDVTIAIAVVAFLGLKKKECMSTCVSVLLLTVREFIGRSANDGIFFMMMEYGTSTGYERPFVVMKMMSLLAGC